MPIFSCDDGNSEVEIEADSPEEAAQQYVNDGDWGEIESTSWVNVTVTGPIPDPPELNDTIVDFSDCDDNEPQGIIILDYCTKEQALAERVCEYCYVAYNDVEDPNELLIDNILYEYWTFCADNASTHDDEPETHHVKITLEPDEPDCKDDKDHDWRSPIEIVGGIEENPGVWGHGGGVYITEVCMNCGTEKLTDTWAQDMSDGEQGLDSVSYEIGKYADEILKLIED